MTPIDAAGWLRHTAPSADAPVRLVCCPHAGGSAAYYRPLAAACGPGVDVAVVQYPGRQDRWSEPALGSVAELADGVAGAVAAADDRPVALFGHSLGASVAFETARRLRDRGSPAVHLFASGCRGPAEPHDGGVHRLDDAGFARELLAIGGTDEEVLREPELMELLLPMLRNDYRAAETYRYPGGDPLGHPVTVFVGEDDATVSVPQAREWGSVTGAGIALHAFPGGHFALMAHLDRVVGVIRETLDAGAHLGRCEAIRQSARRDLRVERSDMRR